MTLSRSDLLILAAALDFAIKAKDGPFAGHIEDWQHAVTVENKLDQLLDQADSNADADRR